ncbi:MAG TPA: mechanosensitive ion channel domain-containing protein [Terriglobales bacterium]|nr:mechanosensitive ion channel domain-containing protein [Terriglobales bacterium]
MKVLKKQTVIAVVVVLVLAAVVEVWKPQWLRATIALSRGDLYRILKQPYFHLGHLPVTLGFLIETFLFLLALTFVSRWIRGFLLRDILVRTPWDPGQQYAVSRVIGYLIFVFGLVIGLQSLGLDLSSLVVLGGALGVGAGFGLQPIVSNFVSGLVLLVERPVRLGDRVEVSNTYGDVIRIGGRSTWIRTNDNEIIIIPNSEFVTAQVTNWTANDRSVRFSLPVGVSYDSNPEQVRELLLEVARQHPDVLPEPAPEVIFDEFGDSSLNFLLRVFTVNQLQTPARLKSDLYFAIFKTFGEHGIEIPFPQRDLHLRSVATPVPLSGIASPSAASGGPSAGN